MNIKSIVQKYTQESDLVINNFINHIQKSEAIESLNMIAMQWKQYSKEEKIAVAKEFAGLYNIHRTFSLFE